MCEDFLLEEKIALNEITEKASKYIIEDIDKMSEKELKVSLSLILRSFEDVKKEWKSRVSFSKINGNHSFVKLYAFFEDYKYLSLIDDCKMYLEKTKQNLIGYVYVIEFEDGSVKIGMSINPEQRIKSISASNQSKLTRKWISNAVSDFQKLEFKAHNHFKKFRLNGEFFSVNFDVAVNWIDKESNKEHK